MWKVICCELVASRVQRHHVIHNNFNCSLRLPIATFQLSLSGGWKTERFATKELHDSVLFFLRCVLCYPISIIPLSNERQREAHTTKANPVVHHRIRFQGNVELLLKRRRRRKKWNRELNFSIVYVVSKKKGDDNLLILLFTLSGAYVRWCASRKLSLSCAQYVKIFIFLRDTRRVWEDDSGNDSPARWCGRTQHKREKVIPSHKDDFLSGKLSRAKVH